jgi:hypothetical protein
MIIRSKLIHGGIVAALMLAGVDVFPIMARASDWRPTLLVDARAFQSIDDRDGFAGPALHFGDSLSAWPRCLRHKPASSFVFAPFVGRSKSFQLQLVPFEC